VLFFWHRLSLICEPMRFARGFYIKLFHGISWAAGQTIWAQSSGAGTGLRFPIQPQKPAASCENGAAKERL